MAADRETPPSDEFPHPDDPQWTALRSALLADYADRGWPVLPLHHVDPDTRACSCQAGRSCGSPGKHPIFRYWQRRATADIYKIQAQFAEYPRSNVGIRTGPEFGLVLDLDPRNGSEVSLARIVEGHGPLPESLRSVTGGGGQHLVFEYPEGARVGNTLTALGGFEGIDIKGQDGLVVVAPSIHPSGGTYRWEVRLDTPRAPVPDWMLANEPASWTSGPRPNGATSYGWAALRGECDRLESVRRGERHNTLISAAAKIGSLVAGGEIPADLAATYLERSALMIETPLDVVEVRSTIESGFGWGRDHPRTAPPPITGREDATATLGRIEDAARSCGWGGHEGRRKWAVLTALIRIATRAGGPSNFHAAVRTIAQEMGTSNLKRVRLGLEELQETGWLRKIRDARGAIGRTWRLRIPLKALQSTPMGTQPTSYAFNGGTSQRPQVAPGHDAFRTRRFLHRQEWDDWEQRGLDISGLGPAQIGLGETRFRIFDHLSRAVEPLRRSDLARGLGVSPSTISRNVVLLKRVGLVVEDDRRRLSSVEATPETFAEIARQLGTAGGALQQREEWGWDSPVRVDDISAAEAAMVPLPETDPHPHPPGDARSVEARSR